MLTNASAHHDLEPLVFRALLLANRADLACPAPRNLLLSPTDSPVAPFRASFCWAGLADTYTDDSDVAFMTTGRISPVGSDTVIVDLGMVPLPQARTLTDLDDRWSKCTSTSEPPCITLGHTYALKARDATLGVDITVAFTITQYARHRTLGLTWCILTARPA